uniref:Uncharacterized protein n=1 Tax=Heliothis virescens TaxID=7102 RepID=A0A2A4J3P9_HELVI
MDRFRLKPNNNQGVSVPPHFRTAHNETQKANRFVEYDTTEVWWNESIRNHEITPQYSFLPTPVGHGMDPDETSTPEPPLRQEETLPLELQDPPRTTIDYYPIPPAFETRPSFPIFTHFFKITPLHPQYGNMTPPKGFPPDFRYPTIIPPPYGEELVPSETKLTLKHSIFTLPDIPDRPTPNYMYPYFNPVPRSPKTVPEEYETNTEKTFTGQMTYTTLQPKISELFKKDSIETVSDTIVLSPTVGTPSSDPQQQQPRTSPSTKNPLRQYLPQSKTRKKLEHTTNTDLGYVVFGSRYF